jgi:SAM-dependent methyltransferase
MPDQGLLDHLYARTSPSVIGEWGEATLTVPEQLMLQHESDRSPGRYFELGVGRGHLYSEFVRRGWACTGVDPGPWAQKFPNVMPDFNSIAENIRADLLVAFDVLEHVSDPVAMLRRLRELAAPGASLYCAMPNCRSLRARLQRERWRMVRPLAHVNYWSRHSIRAALRAAGFELSWLKASDLWRGPTIRTFGDVARFAIDRLGFGDQWIVKAFATLT